MKRSKKGKQKVDRLLDAAFQSFGSNPVDPMNTGNKIANTMYRHFFEEPFKSRRRLAMRNYYDKVMKEYADSKGEYMGMDVGDVFIRTQLLPFDNVSLIDFFGSLRTAAAIWMLEQLAVTGKLEDACKLLPETEIKTLNPENNGIESSPFFVEHALFPARLVEIMATAITFRYINTEDRFEKYDVLSCITPDMKMNGATLHEWYQQILELLPQERVEEACKEFKEKAWECIQFSLESQAQLVMHFEHALHKADKAYNMLKRPVPQTVLIDRSKELVDCGNIGQRSILEAGSSMNGIISAMPKYEGLDMLGWAQKINETESCLQIILDQFRDLFRMPKEKLLEIGMNEALVDRILAFDTGDPFTMCFALFYLADKDDDIVWLFRTTGAFMAVVEQTLPWYNKKSGTIQIPRNMKKIFPNIQPIPEGKEDVYKGNYYRKLYNGWTLGQILYHTSGVVYPTGEEGYHAVIEEMMGKDGTPELINHLSDMARTLVLKRWSSTLRPISDIWAEDQEEEEPEEIEEEDLDNEEDIEALRDEAFKARQEIKRLRKALAQTKHALRKQEADTHDQLDIAEKEHRELADLRELVFNVENNISETANAEEKDDIKYPYKLQQQVVVFGGHDSFLKVMRSNFPDARFVDVDKISFSPEIVKNADIVWIQTNNMNHPQYWNVTRAARLYNKQVRYFTTSGTSTCSRQIVEADKAAIG